MSISITDKQNDALSLLCSVGFAITNFYGDGVIRVKHRDENVAGFIRPDGSVKRQVIPVFPC